MITLFEGALVFTYLVSILLSYYAGRRWERQIMAKLWISFLDKIFEDEISSCSHG